MGGLLSNMRCWIGNRRARMGRAGTRRAPAMLVASRDLPPVDAVTGLTLPRAPAPFSDTELSFALRAAAERTRPVLVASNGMAAPSVASTSAAPATIASGANLRAQLERFEQLSARREALAQAGKAYAAIAVHGLADEPAPPVLRLVRDDEAVTRESAALADDDELGLNVQVDIALASALGALRRMSQKAAQAGR